MYVQIWGTPCQHRRSQLIPVSSLCITDADCLFYHSHGCVVGHHSINITIWPVIFFPCKVKSGLINPLPLMLSKKLHPPHIMFHPASPTVMASQIGLSWGGLGLLCSCCCLIWGLGVLQVLTWRDFKDSQRHINILYETIKHSANESLALVKREHNIM